MKCSSHPAVNAVGECVKCHGLVCAECQVIWEETTYCTRCIDEILGTEAKQNLQRKTSQRQKAMPVPQTAVQDAGKAAFTATVEAPRKVAKPGKEVLACPHCGCNNAEKLIYCRKCATQIQQATCFCSKCGAIVPAATAFCRSCGSRQQ